MGNAVICTTLSAIQPEALSTSPQAFGLAVESGAALLPSGFICGDNNDDLGKRARSCVWRAIIEEGNYVGEAFALREKRSKEAKRTASAKPPT